MCLGTKLSKKKLEAYKEQGEKCGYIRVWKVVEDTGKKFRPPIWPEANWSLYKKGLSEARKGAYDEQQLIHAFRNRESAGKYSNRSIWVILSCLIKPNWVKAIGRDYHKLTLTTKAIVMPEHPKSKVTVREFRAAIKGKKVKTYSWE